MPARLPSRLTIERGRERERETSHIVTLILSLSFHLQDIYLSLSLRQVGNILLSFFRHRINVTSEYRSHTDILESAFALYFTMQISAVASPIIAPQL